MVRDLVALFGGPAELARAIGAETNAVKQWGYRGRVPWQWRTTIRREAQLRGLVLTQEQQRMISLEPQRRAAE